MMMDDDQTYVGDHFVVYTNIPSLCCTPEINIILHSIISRFKKRKRKCARGREKTEWGAII